MVSKKASRTLETVESMRNSNPSGSKEARDISSTAGIVPGPSQVLHYCHSAEAEPGAVGLACVQQWSQDVNQRPDGSLSPTAMMTGREVRGLLEPSVCGVPSVASRCSRRSLHLLRPVGVAQEDC